MVAFPPFSQRHLRLQTGNSSDIQLEIYAAIWDTSAISAGTNYKKKQICKCSSKLLDILKINMADQRGPSGFRMADLGLWICGTHLSSVYKAYTKGSNMTTAEEIIKHEIDKITFSDPLLCNI